MEDLNYRQWIFGLLIDCPMRQELDNCPLKVYRKESSIKKIEIAYSLTGEEVLELVQYHKRCLAKRELMMVKKKVAKL